MTALDVGIVLSLTSPLLLLDCVFVQILHIHNGGDAKSKCLFRKPTLPVRMAKGIDEAREQRVAGLRDCGEAARSCLQVVTPDLLDHSIFH